MKNDHRRIGALVLTVAVIGAAIVLLEFMKPQRAPSGDSRGSAVVTRMGKEEKVKQYQPAKEIVNPSGFINTDSITIDELIGKKVVLVDFWTYSCINCQRTIPFLNAWYEKYRDEGLEIIGVHSPEFEFEKKYENVQAAVEKFGIKYPVVLDNDFATWNAYGNRYWPRKYLIDIDGFIVYDHIGEGAYEETERRIQELLEERRRVLGESVRVSKGIAQPVNVGEVSVSGVQTPEIYFGATRNSSLGNGASGTLGSQTFTLPATVAANALYLVGDWNIREEFAENTNAGAKIILRYHAMDVYLVASAEVPVRMKVLRDGKPLAHEAGDDVLPVGGESATTIQEDRLYKLVHDPQGAGEHTLELIIESPGLRAFTFTFG